MATKCPSFLKIVMDNMDDEEDVEEEMIEEEPSITGSFFQIKSEQFITFSIKESSGRTVEFILLNNFDNSFFRINDIVSII